jgi:hypothetical protein
MGRYQPGQSGNPSGRPAGKKTLLQSNTLLLLKAESLGRGAAPFLRGVYNCPQAPDQLRATAAIALLPYENVRCTDKRVSRPLDMPRGTTVEQCLENIAELKDRAYKGALGLEETTLLIQMEEATIRAIEGTVNERDLKLVESVVVPESVPVRTVVTSSIPALPGTEDTIRPDVSEPPANGPWSPNPPPSSEPKGEPK